jgi:hypothetical protein
LRRRRSAPRFFPSCPPTAPIIARTRGGSEAAILSRRSKRPFSDLTDGIDFWTGALCVPEYSVV